MDKNLVYETFYETIEESLQWGFELKDSYLHWIEGVHDITLNLLDRLENSSNKCECPAEKVYTYSGEK